MRTDEENACLKRWHQKRIWCVNGAYEYEKDVFMKISRVRILPNYRKPWARKLVKNISVFLRTHGFFPAHKNTDATICIGGDGTIFYANHINRISGAVLGIGTKTSAVCQLKRDNWKKYLVSMLKSGTMELRYKLAILTRQKTYSSVNDVVMHTHDYRVIRIFFAIGKKQYSFEGDGIIISTPTGTTGYAYSAGGSIMNTTARKIQLVPICPYKRVIRPMVLNDGAAITIYADRSSDLIIDGIHVERLKPQQKIRLFKGEKILFLK